jgi:hypothetical protein
MSRQELKPSRVAFGGKTFFALHQQAHLDLIYHNQLRSIRKEKIAVPFSFNFKYYELYKNKVSIKNMEFNAYFA